MLTGSELLQLIKDHPEMNRSQLAKAAGYVRIGEDGKEQILVQRFYDAAMAAHGTPVKRSSAGVSTGKKAQHKTTVHKTGILLVGKVYTEEFGAEAGDVFGIEVREDGIWLPLQERDVEVRKVGEAESASGACEVRTPVAA